MNMLYRLLFKAWCLRLIQRISTMKRLGLRCTNRIHRTHVSSAMGRVIHCPFHYEDPLPTSQRLCPVVEHNMVDARKPLLLRQYQQARGHPLARLVPWLPMLGIQTFHTSPYLHIERPVCITKFSY